MEYIAYVRRASDEEFSASFYDFPGCIATGRTYGETRDHAAKALMRHIEAIRESGRPIPVPSPRARLAYYPEKVGAILVTVSVP